MTKERPTVQLRGARRTGTTIMQKLLEEGVGLNVDAKGKHSDVLEPGTNVVLVTKNPYSWLDSILRWTDIDHAHTPKGQRLVQDLMESSYSLRYRWWLAHEQAGAVGTTWMVVQWESILDREMLRRTIQALARTWRVEPRDPGWKPPAHNVSGTTDERGPFEHDPSHPHLQRLPVTLVRNTLRRDDIQPTIELLGYPVEPPGWPTQLSRAKAIITLDALATQGRTRTGIPT